MKLSVAVMAHPAREELVPSLLAQLGDVPVAWDEWGDRWDTGRRAMLAFDASADYHLVVQDDAILCRDFLAGAKAALRGVPELPCSFYLSGCRPHGTAVKAVAQHTMLARLPFTAMPGPLWGVAVAIPRQLIEPMLKACEGWPAIANYDLRMATFFAQRKIPCWYTQPSLANHRVGEAHPSLVPGRSGGNGRVALHWIGARSPLEVDWSRGAFDAMGRFHQTRPAVNGSRTSRSRMARIAPKTLFGFDALGIRRRVPAGAEIPPGLRFDEPLPPVQATTPEERRLWAEIDRRRAEAEEGPSSAEGPEVATPRQLKDMTVPELRDLAAELGVEVKRSGKRGPVRDDYLKALGG